MQQNSEYNPKKKKRLKNKESKLVVTTGKGKKGGAK